MRETGSSSSLYPSRKSGNPGLVARVESQAMRRRAKERANLKPTGQLQLRKVSKLFLVGNSGQFYARRGSDKGRILDAVLPVALSGFKTTWQRLLLCAPPTEQPR